ncbi:Na+/H+ antiporter-like protein [Cavenderia fasciculata]|uniref:Na+/H+ antiporter-like protein n=1 Tax=Cavenderia fasciculata TaxID=261658 RepID=F4Q957_CACFS|nr:Na+/H+ antiporter-like protein [Cavenderia fasciculata]EGG15226.1 Na+/H+ antiporter-like protein [Cavenderia fasciculata]|eukprot:XP_004351946.1 Na+/H+ antiporter-like protein [Cavenderia fasciculata]
MVAHNVLESDVGLFLIQCLLIIILSRILSWLFAKIQQPPVIAEIISGILLGPTAFGKIPGFTTTLFPPASTRILNVFAQIGLLFFMFIIGLELDPSLFRSQIKQSLIISFVSIVFPFGLGLAASIYLADIQGTAWTYSFGIFIGVALCITAFPVLARILASKKLLSTPIGGLAIACAAINDICGWVLLGLSVSLAGESGSLDTLWTLLAAAGFVAIMLLVIRPLLSWAVAKVWKVDENAAHPPSPSHLVMSSTVVLLFIASWLTEIIGIHAMFGAFTLGTITPKIGGFNQAITEKIEDLVLVFLLPLYFVVSGLRTDLTTLNTGEPWLGVLLIVSCACFGKIVGSGVIAKILGKSTRDALSLGILMNTRGLVELIVLNLGLDFGLIHTNVFGIMVLMAVFTTIMTSPLISLMVKREKPSGSNGEQFTVVLCTPSLSLGPSMVDLGYTIGNRVSVSAIRRKKLKKIYFLSISEVNDRPSDFIGQIRKDISRASFQPLIQQGAQMKMKVVFNSIVSDNDHLTKEVVQFTELKNASMLIIGEDNFHGRGGMIGKDTMWSLIKTSTTHVGVFTDKSGVRGTVHRFKRILIAYLGGKNPNDYQTLELANRMAETDGVVVTIVVFDNEFYWKNKRKLIQDKRDSLLLEKQAQEKEFAELTKSPDGVDNSNNINSNNNNNNNNNSLNNSQDPNNNNNNISQENGLKKSTSINKSGAVLAPQPPSAANVMANSVMSESGSTNLSKTTEIYDPLKIQQYESHFERVIYGKNSSKITVVYKPKKQRQTFLLEKCIDFDLMVLPYEQKKQDTGVSPFPSFQLPGMDLMKRSLSMVHLPGRKLSESHHQKFDEEMQVFDNPDNINIAIPQGAKQSTSNLNHPQLLPMETIIEDMVHRTVSDLNDSSDSSLSNPGAAALEEAYWVKCPISTLVVYHKDTIPTHPSELNSQQQQQDDDDFQDDVKQIDPTNPVGDSTPIDHGKIE